MSEEQPNGNVVPVKRLRRLTKEEIEKKAAEAGASDETAFSTKAAYEMQMIFSAEVNDLKVDISEMKTALSAISLSLTSLNEAFGAVSGIELDGVPIELLNRVVPPEKQKDHDRLRKAHYERLAAMKAAQVKNGKIVDAAHEHASEQIGMLGLQGKVPRRVVLSRGQVAAGAVGFVAFGALATYGTVRIVDKRKLRKAGKTKEEKEAFYAQDRTVRAEATL